MSMHPPTRTVEPRSAGALGEVLDETGLADAGLTGDEHRVALAVLGEPKPRSSWSSSPTRPIRTGLETRVAMTSIIRAVICRLRWTDDDDSPEKLSRAAGDDGTWPLGGWMLAEADQSPQTDGTGRPNRRRTICGTRGHDRPASRSHG
jgi:hypothetical protein